MNEKMDKSVYHNIILNEDVEKLLALSDDEKEEFLLVLIDKYLPWKSLVEMNEVQKTLYLASKLEDICQVDALPSLSEEKEFFLALPDIKIAYENLGAFKSAALLNEFIALIPVGIVPEWGWFFEEKRGNIIDKIDGELCDYPDGPMYKIYIAYISTFQNAKQLLTGLGNLQRN